MASEEVLTHLRATRKALLKERAEIDESIDDIDRMIKRMGGGPLVRAGYATEQHQQAVRVVGNAIRAVAQANRQPSLAFTTNPISVVRGAELVAETTVSRSVPTVREAIVAVLDESGTDMKAAEIIEGVAEQGVSAEDDSIRSILVKMSKERLIDRVGYGRYCLPIDDAADDASEESAAGTSID